MTLIGGAATASLADPLAVRAQQASKVHRIAVVHPSHPIADLRETGSIIFFRALFNGLRRLGYVEDRNLIVERYSAEGRNERHAEIVRDVVAQTLAWSRLSWRGCSGGHDYIPIVALTRSDRFGLIASIVTGGNWSSRRRRIRGVMESGFKS